MTKISQKIALIVFFAIFFFGLVWAAIVPPNNEAPDEAAHLQMVYFLKNHKSIPVFNAEVDLPYLVFDKSMLSGAYYSMAYNSPLSYLPYIPFAHSTLEENTKNNLLPLRTISVIFVSLFGLFLFAGFVNISDKKPLLAASITLFFSLMPQVIFSAGYLNIEPVALFLSALSFYFLTCINKNRNILPYILFGISLGFLALCKANYLILVLALGVYAAYKLLVDSKIKSKEKIIRFFSIVFPVFLLNIWWWARNYSLYNDPLIFNYIQNLISKEAPSWFSPPKNSGYNIFSILFKPDFIKYGYLGFYAGLGGANIFLPLVFYVIFYALLFSGIILSAYRSLASKKITVVILGAILVLSLNLLLFGYKNLSDFSPQGRHFFPMIPIIAVLLFLGFEKLKSKILPLLILLFSVFASIYSCFILIHKYFVTGAAYTMVGNSDKIADGFSWQIMRRGNYLNLIETIFNGNSKLFSSYFTLVYFLLFLVLVLILIFWIFTEKNSEKQTD